MKPGACEVSDRLERARLLEEMGCAWNDGELDVSGHLLGGVAVQRNDGFVAAADHEKGWRLDVR